MEGGLLRKLVLLAGMLALVFLVVAPALSQTDGDSNPNDNGIIGDVLDSLGGSDEGNDSEDEAVNLDTDADADANADAGADVGEDEGGDAADSDDVIDEGEGDDVIVDNDDGNDDGGDAIDNDDDVIDTSEGEDGNNEGEGDDVIVDNDDEGDASDDGGDKGDIIADLLDLLGGREGDNDQNSADEDDVAAADKVGAERKDDGRDDARDDDARDILSGDGSESISSFEQDTNSGDITQTFSVTGPGDNASQCLNISPVANSGNAQNQIGGQPGGGNVEFNDVNSTLDVSGGSTVTCNQPINQAATASGGYYSSGY
jgi:hypothetical protein